MTDVAVTYSDGDANGTEGPVPAEMEMEEHAIHDALIEGIVVADDDLMERYLGDEEIEYSELAKALASGVASASVFPVLCGSATKLIGVDRLAKFLVEEAPAPAVVDGAAGALVFKTIVDPYVGHVNLFKVVQGAVKHDDVLTNSRSKNDERMHQLFSMRGKEQDTVNEVPAGDIAAVAKLANTGTGDVLAAKGTTIEIEMMDAPEPLLAVAIHAKSKGDEDKLANALHRLQEEDPVLRIDRNAETHQTVLQRHGRDAPLDRDREARAGSSASRSKPKRCASRTARRSPVRPKPKARSRSKAVATASSRWRGCASSRSSAASGNEFVDAIVGGVIPRNFIPAVEKGIHDTEETGGAFGFPVVDVKVTCYDGKHHPVDSSEMAFKTASSIGLRDALAKANPVLLEPVSELVVTVPEAYQGDIMGDLNGKRGRIQGSAAVGNGEVEITAHVPTSEVLRYAIDLRSMTGGRGRFSAQQSHYDPVPAHLTDKIVAATKEAAAAAH